MSLIEKIDAEIAEVETDRIDIKDGRERDVWNNGYDKGMKKGLQIAKRIILSEQKEPIGNSEQLTERKEPCEGCKHNGNYENELEYGYPSPRTKCKRRCNDNYQPYTES